MDKIISCFTNVKLKIKFQNYFFEKFLIENILPNLKSYNLKKFRTNLQYISTLITFSKNNKIIIDVLSYFLLGLSEPLDLNNITNNEKEDDASNNNDNNKNSNIESNNNTQINGNEISNEASYNNFMTYIDYRLTVYEPNKMRNKILKNMHKTQEYINIIIYELFNIFFKEKPYLAMKNFVKPYTDLVINKSNNKAKFILGNIPSYPISNHLLALLEKYLNKDNIINNIECLLFKNLSFYINQDIDFYDYYVNNKKKEDLLLNHNNQNLSVNQNEEASFRINEDSSSEEQQNNQETLEENIMKGLNSNFLKNLLNPKEKKTKQAENLKMNNNKDKNIINIKDIFENDKYLKEN